MNEKAQTTEGAIEEGKKEASQDVAVPIENVALQQDEVIRITIAKTKDNSLSLHVKTPEGESNVSFFEVIGLLETAKSDMLRQNQPAAEEEKMKMVPITLNEYDFELDADGRLIASGKKVGDVLMVPEQISILRDTAIENMKRREQEKEPKAPEAEVETQPEEKTAE